MSIQQFVDEAWKALIKQHIPKPEITTAESHEGEILFVVDINNGIIRLLDARGTLFMIPFQQMLAIETVKYQTADGQLLRLIDVGDETTLVSVNRVEFMIPTQEIYQIKTVKYKTMSGKLLPISDESLSDNDLSLKVNTALLSVDEIRYSDINKKKILLDKMTSAYHESHEYFRK